MSEKRLPHHHNESDYMTGLCRQVSNTEDFSRVADLFKQLGDLTRVRIFWVLCHCEECVADIASMLYMSSPAVSHHLKVLKDCDLIVSTRNGKEVCYKRADNAKADLMHQIVEQIMEETCPKQDIHAVLDAFVGGQQNTIVTDIHDYMLRHMDEKTTIEELSKKYGINTTTMKHLFKETYGDSIANHMKKHKMEHAAMLLKTTDYSLAEIARKIGYESQSKFTEAFKSYYNQTPSQYKRGCKKSPCQNTTNS